jgi:hypothetical protein
MAKRYINLDLIEQYPNKYNLTPKNIKKLKVLDWEKLKKKTWLNTVMSKSCWCHTEHSCTHMYYDYEDEFWIGFYEDGKIDFNFSCREGMCNYKFDKFYDSKEIENKDDLDIQVKFIKYMNELIDGGVISKPKKEK